MVNLNRIEMKQIMAGLCVVSIVALWHSDSPSLSSALDMRVIHRATADFFLDIFLTGQDFSLEDFHSHHALGGRGLYDFVRQFARRLLQFLPETGRNFVLDFPRGEFQF